VVQVPHSHNSLRRDLISRSVFSSFHDIAIIVVVAIVVIIIVSRLFITCAAFLAETILSVMIDACFLERSWRVKRVVAGAGARRESRWIGVWRRYVGHWAFPCLG
jgi:ABC-type bacteriocin/lantibiotic exporter with double-glycine peptidase domain